MIGVKKKAEKKEKSANPAPAPRVLPALEIPEPLVPEEHAGGADQRLAEAQGYYNLVSMVALVFGQVDANLDAPVGALGRTLDEAGAEDVAVLRAPPPEFDF